MPLNYTPPKFRFIVGTLDVTTIVHGWNIHSKALEINSDGCWQGSFTIGCGMTGRDYTQFPDSLMDPLTSPTLWRPSQSSVTIAIEFGGTYYSLPRMRIDKYTWNPQTRTGEGTLIQFCESLNKTRPAMTPELKIGQQVPLKEVIEKLIDTAQLDSPQKMTRTITGITGVLDSAMTTRNPIADVQKLCGVNWQWLTVDSTESIVTVSGTPEDYPILFSRSIGDVVWEPDIQNINFAAPKVIVTGSRQVPDPHECGCTPSPDHNKYVDSKGRTKIQTTEEKKPYKEVFEKSPRLDETIAERKTIMYRYLDKEWMGGVVDYISFFDYGGVDVGVSYDIQVFVNKSNPFTCKGYDEMTPIATVTVKEWPRGRINTKFGEDGNFSVAEILIEGPTLRARIVPIATVNDKDPQNLNLMWVSKEELKNDRNTGKCGTADPKTGKASCVTSAPQLEAAQPGAEVPLITEVIKAEAEVLYNGWYPLIKDPHIEEVGFIPSQKHGDKLAMQIARREERRRNAVQVSMPIGSLPEYFIAGCPIVGRARVYDGDFGFEAVIISYAKTKAEISFSCGRINQFSPPVPSPIVLAPYIPVAPAAGITPVLQLIAPTTTIALQTGTVNYIQVSAGGGV